MSAAPETPGVPDAVAYREIREVLRTFRDSGWTGMTVTLHGMRITVGRDGPPAGPQTARPDPAAARPAVEDRRSGPDQGGIPPRTGPDGRSPGDTAPPAEPGDTAPPAEPGDLAGTVEVRSPAVGAFWIAPSPGQPPFVQVGQDVAADEQLAIVEVMKLMNPVLAPVAGTVVRVGAVNADLVEYDQVLFWIRPGDG